MYQMMNKLIDVIQVYHVSHYKFDYTSWEYRISNYMFVDESICACSMHTHKHVYRMSHLDVKWKWGQQLSFIKIKKKEKKEKRSSMYTEGHT